MKALPAPARLSEVRFTRMAELDPLEHAYRVGWHASRLEKEPRTSMHIFPRSSTIPTRPYHIPTHPSASLHKPTTAVVDAQTIVRMGLKSPNTLLFLLLGDASGGIGRVTPRYWNQTTGARVRAFREDQRFETARPSGGVCCDA